MSGFKTNPAVIPGPPSGPAGGGLNGTYPNPGVNGLTAGVLTDDTAHGSRGGGALHSIATGVTAGFMSAADKTKLDLSSGGDSFQWTVGRNAATTDLWLRKSQNIPTNQSPFVVPFNATIVAISAATNSSATWDAEVYRNADVRAGGVPTDGNKLAELVVSAVDSAYGSVSVNVDAGDEIGIFCRGTSIPLPSVSVFLVRR